MINAYIGGGAAGYFAAIAAAEKNPKIRHIIFEATTKPMSKIKISGGGRCNVTHQCFNPSKLVQNYPRGNKELLSAFSAQFQPKHMIEWLAQRGVEVRSERDGRVFPVSNSSDTIIRCFENEVKRLGIEVRTRCRVSNIEPTTPVGTAAPADSSVTKTQFALTVIDNNTRTTETVVVNRLLLATGSFSTSYDLARKLGHLVVPPVPSLFTFNCQYPDTGDSGSDSSSCSGVVASAIPLHPLLEGMAGTSFPHTTLKLTIQQTQQQTQTPTPAPKPKATADQRQDRNLAEPDKEQHQSQKQRQKKLGAVSAVSYTSSGPLLITHWGLSGPAVLKLSAFAALPLHASGYTGQLSINWLGTGTGDSSNSSGGGNVTGAGIGTDAVVAGAAGHTRSSVLAVLEKMKQDEPRKLMCAFAAPVSVPLAVAVTDRSGASASASTSTGSATDNHATGCSATISGVNVPTALVASISKKFWGQLVRLSLTERYEKMSDRYRAKAGNNKRSSKLSVKQGVTTAADAGIGGVIEVRWGELTKTELNRLATNLTEYKGIQVTGKGVFKEEFVSAGGVDCKEVDWRTMESKQIKGVYFAGECLNVDGVTGGFNFQNAWTTSWIAAQHMARL